MDAVEGGHGEYYGRVSRRRCGREVRVEGIDVMLVPGWEKRSNAVCISVLSSIW